MRVPSHPPQIGKGASAQPLRAKSYYDPRRIARKGTLSLRLWLSCFRHPRQIGSGVRPVTTMHGLRPATLRVPVRPATLVISMRGKRSGVFRGPSSPGADSGVATGKVAKECQQQCQLECEIGALFEHELAS